MIDTRHLPPYVVHFQLDLTLYGNSDSFEKKNICFRILEERLAGPHRRHRFGGRKFCVCARVRARACLCLCACVRAFVRVRACVCAGRSCIPGVQVEARDSLTVWKPKTGGHDLTVVSDFSKFKRDVEAVELFALRSAALRETRKIRNITCAVFVAVEL